MAAQRPFRITGSVSIEARSSGSRLWIATYRGRDGKRHRKTLGPAWAKETSKRTARGAAVYRAADGSKPSREYLTPKEAQDALAELLHSERLKPAVVVEAELVTFERALDGWYERISTVGGVRGPVAMSTLQGYASAVALLRSEFGGDRLLRDISAADVRAFQKRLQTVPRPRTGRPMGLSKSRQVMQRLRQVLDFAIDEEWLEVNVARKVALPPPATQDPDFNVLEPSSVEAVARAVADVLKWELPLMRNGKVDKHSLAAMTERRVMYSEAVRFLAYTGIRAGELRALRWRDVDIAHSTVRVVRANASTSPGRAFEKTPKGVRGRAIPLIPSAITALDAVSKIGHSTDPEALVFPTRNGEPIDTGRVRDAFYRGLDAAGFGHMRTKKNPMTLHDLRHTFGTIAARVFPLQDVQAYLGHSDIETTMRYLHHVPRGDAAEKLAAAFAEDLAPMTAQAPA